MRLQSETSSSSPAFGALAGFSTAARIEAGVLLRGLQLGERLSMPYSRPMPGIGPGCHELRIPDRQATWRIVYHLDEDAVVVLAVFQKTSQQTPQRVISECRRRMRDYRASR